MPLSTKLNVPQKRWCELVNNGMNRTKAAAEVWPQLKAHSQKAYMLGQLPHVQGYLAQLDANAMEEAGVTRKSILVQLKAIAEFDVRKLYKADGSLKDIHELDDETAAALASLEIEELIDGVGETAVRRRTKKVRHWSKTEALRMLAQIRGLLKNELELSGNGVLVRVVDLTGAKKPEGDAGG